MRNFKIKEKNKCMNPILDIFSRLLIISVKYKY